MEAISTAKKITEDGAQGNTPYGKMWVGDEGEAPYLLFQKQSMARDRKMSLSI